ncbi:MAG: hypothetical protein A2Z08_08010 [Deltaproteobacteria bacterium RBG_16_54_11]|nr:MAG: hypothetical protein A2Z08_08010 [Deltaproteobacteria bacterium RBG_16_54_11]
MIEKILELPRPGKDEAEILFLYNQDSHWKIVEGYLKRCLAHIGEELGKTENTRDFDMALKGIKAGFDHIIGLPEQAGKILHPTKEDIPDEL